MGGVVAIVEHAHPFQGDLEIPDESGERPRQGRLAGDDDIIMTGKRVRRHDLAHGFPKATAGPVPCDRRADLAAGGQPNAKTGLGRAIGGAQRCRPAQDLKDETGPDTFSAGSSNPEILRPRSQAPERRRHGPKPKGACGPWPGAWTKLGGRRRWPCAHGIRADVYER